MTGSSPRRARWVASILLAAPVLCVCSPFLFTGRSLAADDFREYFGPHALFAQEQVRRSGELPRWNPHQYAGAPFLGSGQNNFYYPPHALFLFLQVDRAFGLLVALHLLIASAGAYRLARTYGLRREAAVVSGVAFGLSFALIARLCAGHLPNLVSICLAPWLLAGVRRAVDRPSAKRFVELAWIGALSIAGGNPQVLYQTGLLCAAQAVMDLWTRSGRGPRAGFLAGAVGAAAALSAVHLLPLLETASLSNRDAATRELVEPFHDFDPSQLVLLTVPHFFWRTASDPWIWREKAMYLGVLPLILAALSFAGKRRPAVLFLGGVVGVALLEALSGHLLGWLPWYGAFRIPERILWVAVLALAVLAGFGWNDLMEGTSPLRGRRRLAAVGAGVAAWAVLIAIAWQAREGTILFLAAGAGAVAALSLADRRPLAAVVVVMLDLGGAALLELKTVPGPTVPSPVAVEAAIGAERSAYRLVDLTGYKAAGVGHGFRLLRGYGHPVSPDLERLYASAWKGSIPALDTLSGGGMLTDPAVLRELNVRWILGGAPPSAEWKTLGTFGGAALYEDPGAKGEAFLANGAGAVKVTRPDANRISVQVTADRAASLVVSESWAPGWTADIGGRRAEIVHHRGALMSVGVPAGTSEVLLTYAPAVWKLGRWISGLAFMGLLIAAVAARSRRVLPPV